MSELNRDYKEKSIPLNGNRKLINRCKKAGLHCYNPRGDWNGYGYEKLPMKVLIRSVGEMRKFNRIKKELEAEPVKKEKTAEEKKEEWCKRLAKLTGITMEDARDIAEEKLDYQQDRINMLILRQNEERCSKKREKLINKLYRENPLRYIKDEEHAFAILAASKRHCTSPYEEILDWIHDLEDEGIIPRGYAKELARAGLHREDPYEYVEKIKEACSDWFCDKESVIEQIIQETYAQ